MPGCWHTNVRHNRIVLEPIPSDGENLHKFIGAMKRSVRVKLVYRKYGESEVRERVVDPYFVKLTNKRWYGIVHKPDDKGHIFVLGFDRVQSLELIKVLSPQWLADEIKRQHLEAAELYKG